MANKSFSNVKVKVTHLDLSKDASRSVLVSGENISHSLGKIARWYKDISWVGHTHSSFDSSVNKGAENQPVYILNGVPTAIAYTIKSSVPANAVFTDTDTKVTAVGNHYTPSGGTTTSASGGTLTDITNSANGVQVVTGVTKDAAGHVTGVTSIALKSVNSNTTYAAGTGISMGTGNVINHANSITAVTTAVFKKFTYDAQGHITGTAAVAAADLPSHTHTKSQITDFPTSLPASDVYSWAKASTKPTYTASEVGALSSTTKYAASNSVSGPALYVHDSNDLTKGPIELAYSGSGLTADQATHLAAFTQEGKGANSQVRIRDLSFANLKIKLGLGSAAYTASTAYAASSHTHSYAKSESVNGPAYSVAGTVGTTEEYRHVWFSVASGSGSDRRAYADNFKYEPALDTLKFGAWYPVDITGQTVNLNDYTDGSGKRGYRRYICKTTGGGTNISNKPSDSPFVLEVILIRFATVSTDFIAKQIYHSYNKKTYQRFCVNNTWDAWTEIKTTDTNTTYTFATGDNSGSFKVTPSGGSASNIQIAGIKHVAGDSNGHGIIVQNGGLTMVGAGESATALQSAASISGTAEELYLTSDNNIYLYTNCQTIANRRYLTINGSAQLVGGTGGNWILSRENAPVKNTTTSTGGYHPVVSSKTATGEWSIGALGSNERIYFSYTTDANYNASPKVNTAKSYYIDADGNYSGKAATAGVADSSAEVSTVVTDPSSQTTYGVIFSVNPDTSQVNTMRKSNDFRINHFRGAANTEGLTELVLGNSTAKTAANNSTGRVTMWGNNGYAAAITNTNGLSANQTVTMPNLSGVMGVAHYNSIGVVTRGTDSNITNGGYWAGMTTKHGYTGVAANKWRHVLSMDWSGSDLNNWQSQLLIPTQDSYNATSIAAHTLNDGIAYRTNPGSGNSITTGTWITLIDTANYKTFITPANIGAAASSHSHSYVNTTNSTATNQIQINPTSNTSNSYNEGLRIGKASNNWSNINFGCSNTATSGTQDGQWLVGARGAAGTKSGAVGDFTIENNGSTGTGLTLYKNGNTPTWNGTAFSMSGHTHSYIPLAGSTGVTGEIVTTSANGFRLVNGSYGAIIRNDASDWWFLVTAKAASNDAAKTASWADPANLINKSHPLRINLATGRVYINGYTIDKSVPSNADFTNTWRGIQDNLTSTSTTESLSANQGKVLNDKTYQKRGSVSNTTDWNTLTSPGCYKVQMAAWGDADTYHSPNKADSNLYSFGLLFVMVTTDTSEYRVLQMYIPHNTDNYQVWCRMHNSSKADFSDGWRAWSRITATPASHTHSYLPLSGGTLTGGLTLATNQYTNNSKFGIDCKNSDIINANILQFGDLADSADEGIQFYRDGTKLDAIWVKNGVMYFTPNHTQGSSSSDTNYTVYHSGNLTLSTLGGASSSHTHSYLPLSGGTMTGTISSSVNTATYLNGNKGTNVIINSTSSAGSYTMLVKMNSTNGYFTHGTYQTRYELHYTAKSTVDAGTNAVTKHAVLLDESGNASWPGTITASTFAGNATTATTLATARTINGVSFNGSANITVPRSIKHIHYAVGTNGTGGYVKICTVGTSGAYGDQPLRITVGQRKTSVYDIFIVFENSGAAKATIRDAYFRSNRLAKQTPQVHYYLNSDGYYDIYVTKSENYDHIYIMDYIKSDGDEGNQVSLTWTDTLVSTLPSGSVAMSNEMNQYYNTGSRTANTVLAAPNGSAGTATFRALVAADLPASGATAGSYGPSANASPAHSGTFSVPYLTVDAKGRVTAISTKTITLPASGNTDSKVRQSATTTANYRGIVLGYTNNTDATTGRETDVTNETYITNKIFAQPSTGTLWASNLNAWISGTSDVVVGLIRSGNSSWRLLNTSGNLYIQNNYYSSKTQSWYTTMKFNCDSTNKIEIPSPPTLTSTNRSLQIGYDYVAFVTCDKSGWAMDNRWMKHDGTTSILRNGVYGNADGTMNYMYWSEAYNGTANTMRFYKSDNGLVTSCKNGFRIVAGGYGAFFRNDGSDFYLLLTDKKTDGSEWTASWNGKRPFRVNLSSGLVEMAHGLQLSGGITFKTANSAGAYLIAYDTGNNYNQDVVFQSSGSMIIGAGESAAAIYTNNVESIKNSENMALGSDGDIFIYTGANTINARKRFKLTSGGNFGFTGIQGDWKRYCFWDGATGGTDSTALSPASTLMRAGVWGYSSSIYTYFISADTGEHYFTANTYGVFAGCGSTNGAGGGDASTLTKHAGVVGVHNGKDAYYACIAAPSSLSGYVTCILPTTSGSMTDIAYQPSAELVRHCRAVHDGSDVSSKPWHKVASINVGGTYQDRTAVFLVTARYLTRGGGILVAHVRTTGTAGTAEAVSLRWIVRSSQTEFNSDRFQIRYTNNTGSSKNEVTVEIWCKIETQYFALEFDLISANDRHTTNSSHGLWTLNNDTTGSASYTAGTGGSASVIARIANHSSQAIGAKSANGYWGMTDPDLADNVWIRTTSNGIIPYQSGGAGSGHGSLGTSTWYFANAYIDAMHGTADRATNSNNCKTTVTDPSSNTSYGIVFVADPNTSEDNTLRKSNDFRFNHWRGAANTEGWSELILGNSTAKTAANNSTGRVSFYNGTGNWAHLNAGSYTSNVEIYLPSSGGTMTNVVYKTAKTASAVSNTGWTNNATDDNIVPTMSFMAYWNGRYNSGSSNLQYCNRGAFGTIVTAGVGDYVKVAKVLWTGTVATTARGERSYTLANKATGYNIIKILYTSSTMSGGAAGCLEINGTKTAVPQPVVVAATATSTMQFYFKISSDGATITVGSNNDVITITGIYGLLI